LTDIDLGIKIDSTFDTYIVSLYYIVVTMLTVGYGDIHATNNNERAFAIAKLLTGGILFGALLSKVTLLIDKRDPQAKAYKEKMSQLRSYLDGIPLTLELKNEAKVTEFFHFIISINFKYNINANFIGCILIFSAQEVLLWRTRHLE
jgi:hypothetical protein